MHRLFIIISLLTSIPTFAEDSWDFARVHKDICSKGGMREMNSCLSNEYYKVDEQLNNTYNELKQLLNDPQGLIQAQRAWIKFRDKECEFSAFPKEGSLAPYAEYACLIDITNKRIRDFNRYLSWSGCNGCPW